MPSNIDKLPTQDPYDLLGVPFTASNAEISKAYRKLALKLHPDKQRSQGNLNLSLSAAAEVAKKFHDVKEARTFLLDDDHAEARRKYDAKRESDRLRQQTETLREKSMSERRRRLREELKEKEAKEKKVHRQRKKEDDIVTQLRNEGKRKRQEYAERDAQRKEDEEVAVERKVREKAARLSNKTSKRDRLEERQIRLKWDRKKTKPSPSEESLAKLLSEQFGSVESTELLGRKGNQALVTFVDQSSCKPCVDFYATSLVMRAKYVGRRKEEEEDGERSEQQDHPAQQQQTTTATAADNNNNLHRGPANESLEDRRMRQAVERERMMRQLEEEQEEEGNGSSSKRGKDALGSTKKKKQTQQQQRSHGSSKKISIFPLPLPDDDNYNGLSPFEALEKFEAFVLGTTMSQEKIRSMQ